MENIRKAAAAELKKVFSFSKTDIAVMIFGFLLGRTVLFNVMSPFALAFFAAYCRNNPDRIFKSTALAFFAVLGAYTSGIGLMLIKYILAFILFGLVFTAVSALTESPGRFAAAFAAAAVLAVSGIIFMGQSGAVVYSILMLVLECIVCFASCILSQNSLKALEDGKYLTPEAVGWLFVLLAVTLPGLDGVSLGGISLGKVLTGVYIMTAAVCAPAGFSAAAGICVGFLYSFAMYPATECIGNFGICGLLCGFLSRYKRAGSAAGYVIANVLLYMYCGTAVTVLETASSVIIFLLISKNALAFAEGMVYSAMPADVSAKAAVKKIAERLTALSKSFFEMAEDFGKNMPGKIPDNTNDIMVLYDKTADKVCRRCGMKFICWEKEFNSTYDRLMHLNPVLAEKGSVEVSDVPQPFRVKCIKLEYFLQVLNKYYARYRLDNMWVKQVEAGKQLVSRHLYGISEIMSDFAEETKNQLDFVPNPDNILYLALRKHDIKCTSVGSVKNELGQTEVTVRTHVSHMYKEKIEDITSQIMGRRFYAAKVHVSDDGEKATVQLAERERFKVTAGGAVRTKDGSKSCGDSCRQQKIGHNRHIAILSDGMGSGENAKRQSNYAVEVMLRLLSCGFDRECAVKIMNLSLYLRQSEESFATVDAAVIDLFEGNADFIKIGAAASYIKSGGKIRCITSNSLPAGMLTDITPCTERVKIVPGDIIVMASDGICGAEPEWLPDYIKDCSAENPQILADNILKEAVLRNDYTASDDMTVMTLLIEEEIA